MATTKIIEEVQKGMAERYDKEFNEIRYFVDEAYELGLAEGRAKAKAEIINLINGDQ
jgi:flagellar biosynthesis/type III secretory pathway protein FliH